MQLNLKPRRGRIIFLLILCSILFLTLIFLSESNIVNGSDRPENISNNTQDGILISASGEQYNFTMINVTDLDLTFQEKCVLTSIKGIINENSSNLYIIDDSASNNWFPILNTTPYLANEEVVGSLIDIISYYKDNFSCVITFNESDPAEMNIATPLSGIYNALMIPNDYYETIATHFFDPFSIYLNLTDTLKEKTTRLEKYQFAYDNYFDLCNQSALALFPGTAPRHLRSFLVSNNIFTLWQPLYVYTEVPDPPLYPDPDEEQEFFEQILDETAENIPIYGYMWPDGTNEGVVIKLISQSNKHLIPSDWISNLAFHSRMKLPEDYIFSQDRSAPLLSLEDKIYITGVWSDGDNIQYVQNFMKTELWDADTPHGQVPTGWTVNPSLYTLAPYVVKHYYDTATENNYFMGGLSGLGYCKLDYYTNLDVLRDFLSKSQQFWDIMDIQEARLWKLDNTADLAMEYTDLNGVFDGYGGGFNVDEPRIVQKIPIIKSVGVNDNIEAPMNFIRNITALTPNRPLFIFFHLLCWDCTTEKWTQLAEDLQALDGVEVVRPDQICNLMNLWATNPSRFLDDIGNGLIIFSTIALMAVLTVTYGPFGAENKILNSDSQDANEKQFGGNGNE
ncbi:MAG: hypothetical protein GF364_10965 [Candidatus Lokiarchaeota archaeon]|nr:hypothetical protein [Candidatus Lokiarchaeota archaeon]